MISRSLLDDSLSKHYTSVTSILSVISEGRRKVWCILICRLFQLEARSDTRFLCKANHVYAEETSMYVRSPSLKAKSCVFM